MPIREGIEEIEKRNKQVQEALAASAIPELVLREDGEVAIFRILTDRPADFDAHETYDPTVGGRPEFPLCRRPDQCEYCDKQIRRTRMFAFWIWLRQVLHPNPSSDQNWPARRIGSRTYFIEEINSVHLLKRKFGRGNILWNAFKDAYDLHGTWLDRDYSFRRAGAPRDINTTYSLTGLDKEPLSKELVEIAGRLPPLTQVISGAITSLDGIKGISKKTPPQSYGSESGERAQVSQRPPGGRRETPDIPVEGLSEEIPDNPNLDDI